MNDLSIHLLLFLALSSVIVLVGVLYGEPDDKKALAMFPRKLIAYFVGCAILSGLILLAEHTVASVS